MELFTKVFPSRILTHVRFAWMLACFLAILHLFQESCDNRTTPCLLHSFFKFSDASSQAIAHNNVATNEYFRHLLRPLFSSEASLEKIVSVELPSQQSKIIPGDFMPLLIRLDDYQRPVITSTTDQKSKEKEGYSRETAKYVYILGFWEQLSQSLISLIDLALLNRFTQRRVVVPRVNNSLMGSFGENLHFYINVSDLNERLEAHEVSGLVDEQEFAKECGTQSQQLNLTVHFLYSLHWNSYLLEKFGRKEVNEVMKSLKGKKWMDCTKTGIKAGNRELCVNPLNVHRTDYLEDEILRNKKCVVISEWRGLGHPNLRLHVYPSAPSSLSVLIQSRLRFNEEILNEAKSFLKAYQDSSLLAVHVRAEWLLTPTYMAMKRFLICLDILKETVSLMKSERGVRNVFLFADFGKHGSGTWSPDKLQELSEIHENLVKSLNATCYQANSESKPFLSDRGAVALVEMTIASLSNNLVTVGRGTFQDWIVSKFTRNNFKGGRHQGSLLRVCSKTSQFP